MQPLEINSSLADMNRGYALLATARRGTHGKTALAGVVLVLLSPFMERLVQPEWREVAGFRLWWLMGGAGVLVVVDSLVKYLREKRTSSLIFTETGISTAAGQMIGWQEFERVYVYRQQFEAHGVPSEHARVSVVAHGRKHTLLDLKVMGSMNPETGAAFETVSDGVALRALPHQKQAMRAQWGTGRGYRFGWRIEARREALRYRSLFGTWKTIRWQEVIAPELYIRNYWIFAELWIAVLAKRENGKEGKIMLGGINRTPNMKLLWQVLEDKGEG